MKSNCCNAEAIVYATQQGVIDYICEKCSLSCEVIEEYSINDLIEAYKLGYADRNAKMPPFNDQDPEEYIRSYLKRI